jgi:hypothetical protein
MEATRYCDQLYGHMENSHNAAGDLDSLLVPPLCMDASIDACASWLQVTTHESNVRESSIDASADWRAEAEKDDAGSMDALKVEGKKWYRAAWRQQSLAVQRPPPSPA